MVGVGVVGVQVWWGKGPGVVGFGVMGWGF